MFFQVIFYKYKKLCRRCIIGSRGVTVFFPEVFEFDKLSLEEATRIIYDELIPTCESKGVMLSSQGNHNSISWLSSMEDRIEDRIEEYQEKKANRDLFDIKRIQKAFFSIPTIVRRSSDYRTRSYDIKHILERHEYITNGDLIVAMLLKGYKARFGKITEPMSYSCEFQVLINKT